MGRARAVQTPQHAHDADGADADLHRLLRLLRRLPLHPVDDVPRLAQHLLLADDARRDRDGDHVRLRGRLHGRLVREQGRPVLDALRRPRRRDLRLGRRRRRTTRRSPTCSRSPAACSRSGSAATSRRTCGSTMPSARSPSTASAASTASSSSASSPADIRPGSTTSRCPSAGSSWACWLSCRSLSCRATCLSWILKKLNLLRVPPEVELEGLDLAEFGQDFYPEFERVPEVIEPDGREVESAHILLEAYRATTNGRAPTKVEA